MSARAVAIGMLLLLMGACSATSGRRVHHAPLREDPCVGIAALQVPADTAVEFPDPAGWPRRTNRQSPAYPADLRRAGISGTVLVTFVVDTAGRVVPRSAVVDRSSHPAFTESVCTSLRRLWLEPMIVDGRALRVRAVRYPVHFDVY